MAQKRELAAVMTAFQERDILSSCANPENFLNLNEKQQIVYLGIDCTADSLHIGHLLPFMQTVRLAAIGFRVKLLLGGATSRVGDPSDKLKERPLIEQDILFSNQKSIEEQLNYIFRHDSTDLGALKKKPLYSFFFGNQELLFQIYRVLDLHELFTNSSPEQLWRSYLQIIWPSSVSATSFALVNNHDWLSKLKLVEFIENYGRKVTVNYLLGKETVRQRIASKSGLSLAAFTYPLLQAYDFFHLYTNYHCHGQVGASDQWGNFTTGLKMISSIDHNNKCFALTFKLLLNEKGKKISKSGIGHGVLWLARNKTSFSDFFNYFSNMPDEQALQYFRKFTFLSTEKIKMLLELNKPASLRILQRILTELFFFLVHGKDGLLWLQENTIINQKAVRKRAS